MRKFDEVAVTERFELLNEVKQVTLSESRVCSTFVPGEKVKAFYAISGLLGFLLVVD